MLKISRLNNYTLVIYATLMHVLYSQNQQADRSYGAKWCVIYCSLKYYVGQCLDMVFLQYVLTTIFFKWYFFRPLKTFSNLTQNPLANIYLFLT